MTLNSRQKIILRFLLKQQATIGRTALMKWLFLFSRKYPSSINSYDFVPYRFGPFSFEAQQNISQSLARYIEEVDNGFRLRIGVEGEVLAATDKIKKADLDTIDEIWSQVNHLPREDLLDQVYRAYPWYASRSELAARKPECNAEIAVYTSGYEGRSVDAFLDCLLKHRIKGVLDVRRNAYSHKYGFSGSTLRNICEKLEIKYDHIPELGVASELRKDLSRPDDFTKLFDDYENHLPRQKDALAKAAEIVRLRPTTLMCFEAKSECCHRGRLAPIIASQTNLKVEHL